MKKILLTAAIAASATLFASAGINSADNSGYSARAKAMYADRNYVGCIDQMSFVLTNEPSRQEREDADYYIAMSAAHLDKTDAKSLLKLFVARYPESPRRVTAIIAVGYILADEGRYNEALQTYNRIDPDAFDSATLATYNYQKAYCLMKLGNVDKALPLYRSLQGTKYANDARFYEGYIAYLDDDFANATRLLKGVNTSKAPANMADYYLSQIYYMEHDYNRAAATARRLMNLDVDSEYKAEAARVAGESLYHLGNDAEAIPLLRQYIEETSQPLPSALYILGVADYRVGDYDIAITRLTPVSTLDTAMGQSANLFIGQALMQKGEYSSAMIALEKAFNVDYDRDVQETAFYNYAVASTEGGRIPFGNSVATFEEFLRRFPDSRYAPGIEDYIITGYMTANNYPAALASIEKIKNPSAKVLAAKQQVLYTLGTRELSAGDTRSAIDHLREALTLSSHNPHIGAETQLWLGQALYSAGEYGEAVRSFEAYLANPDSTPDNHPLALYDLGYARFGEGAYDKARDTFSKFTAAPGNTGKETLADAYNRLADCYYYASDFPLASEIYRKAYDTNPAAGDYALYQSALMKGLTRKYREKISGMTSMIETFPSSGLVPQALLEIGESHAQLHQPDKAVETYSLLASHYPSTEQGRQANLLLALAYLNDGNRSAAITTYKNLITAAPASVEATRALDNLKIVMADEGHLTEYQDFVARIPGAKQIETDELESLSFASAEREYLASGMTGRLEGYLDRFHDGTSRPQALAYAMKGAQTSGNRQAMTTYATELIQRYPGNALVADALKARADAYLSDGLGNEALADYTALEQAASDPWLVNEARIGVMRTARDLALYDRAIEAANALTASSTITDEQRSEARFTRALANSLKGNDIAAAAEWGQLATNLDDLYGTKAAYFLAEQQFRSGKLQHAHESAEALVNSDTPYNYWYARAVILLSDIYREEGNTYVADAYLSSLRDRYPGSETDIFNMIDTRLNR